MPYVVNGIGTWYYGKKHIHTHNGTCQFCHSAGALTSYDTTLFFVVLFVPLVPLGRKRILQECTYCRKHRAMGLKQWEKAKTDDATAVLDELSRDSKNREAAVRAVMLASAYQDEPFFNQVTALIAGGHRRDGTFQAQLGDTYGYFARWTEAERAYRTSLDVEDTEDLREALAWTLLKQSRPQEARGFVKHIINDKKQKSAGLVFWLIKGYQAEGMHDEALELMDARDKAFPEQANLSESKKQRKTSQRYRGTQKRVGSLKDARAGYQEGNWTARVPGWIAAMIFLGLLGLYFGSAWWIGEARKIYLVNGTGSPYAVSIQGQVHRLPPRSAIPVRVAEGDVEAAFSDAKLNLPPIHAHIETNFWSRPFVGRTFVINPDQLAMVVQEETFYAEANPPPTKMLSVNIGQVFYEFSGMNFEFEAFPVTQQVSKGQTVSKTRVALGPAMSEETLLTLIVQRVPVVEHASFCERQVKLDPTNASMLHWLTTLLEPEAMLKTLEARLADRPIRVEWHRAFQSIKERREPDADLRPRYQELVTETKEDPNSLYLLARIEPDPDKAIQLLNKGAKAEPPGGYAVYSLGYHAFSEGRYPEAVTMLENAIRLLPGNVQARHYFREALLADRQYDRLLTMLQAEAQNSPMRKTPTMDIMRVNAIRGEKDKARTAMAQAIQFTNPAQQEATKTALEGALCLWEGDEDAYLKTAGPAAGSFESALLRGQDQLATDFIATRPKQEAASLRGLLYLAAARSGNKERQEVHWQALLGSLRAEGREERRLGEALNKLPSDFPWQRLVIEPRYNRVLLAVLAQRNPSQANPMLELARRLDYHHDGISLCLRKVLKQ